MRVEFYVDLVGKCVDTDAAVYAATGPSARRGGLLFYLIDAVAFDAAGNAGSAMTLVLSR